MHTVSLVSLQISGFCSFTETVSVSFDDTAGLKFITGDNKLEPRLGANGVGKSSFWEALVWCLFGVSSGGHRTAQLVATSAKRAAVVAVLDIDGTRYAVSRSGPPARLTIDEEAASQEQLTRLLGLSRRRFLQSVIFGQMAPMFYDLSVPQRGELLDEILDLELWQHLSELAQAKCKGLEAEVDTLQRQVAHDDGQLRMAERTIEDIAAREAAWQQQHASIVEAAIVEVEQADAEADRLAVQINRLRDVLPDKQLLENFNRLRDDANSNLVKLYTAQKRAEQLVHDTETEFVFYQTHEICPACRQPISEKTRRKQLNISKQLIQEQKYKLGSINVAVQNNEADKHTAEASYTELHERYTKSNYDLIRAQDALDRQQSLVKRLYRQAERLAEEANPHTQQLAELRRQKIELQEQIDRTMMSAAELRGQTELVRYWRQGFKLVRLYLVKQFLAYLAVETSNAAEALGLLDWKIEYVTEVETQSGTSRPGVRIMVTGPGETAPRETWSGGETQRIKLADALGMAQLIQTMSGVDYKFEVWDEPSAWLSPEGIEDLLELLKFRAEQNNASIWLLDHRALIYSGFREIWCISKDANGSRLERLSGRA